MRQAFASGPRIMRFDKRYLHKSGQVLWGEVSAALICDSEGKPSYFIAQVLDISERKRSEEQLHNSERTLRTLIDASPEGIVLLDTDETILIANETAACRLGGPVEEVTGQRIHTFVPPEVAIHRVERFREVIRTGKPIRFEDQRSEHYFEIAMHPVLDEQGKVAAVAILGIDQTEHKRTEEALKKAHNELERRVEERTAELQDANERLQQSHDELQTIYDGMADGLLVTDIETKRLMRTNASICRMLGYSESELRSLSVKNIHPAEALPYILERISLVEEANQTPPGDIPFLRKDGSVFYAEVVGKFLTYNGRPCSMGIFRDITERKRAEEALQQAHDQLQTIYDGIIEGSHHYGHRNKTLCACELYAVPDAWLHGGRIAGRSLKDIHPPEEVTDDLREFQAIAEGRASVQQDRPVLRKDGSIFYADITGHKIVYKGRPCTLAFWHDVTERKRAEETLQREHRTLKHLLQSSDHERQTIAYEIHDGLAQQLAGAIMQFQTYAHQKEARPKDAAKAFDAGMTMFSKATSKPVV